MSPHESFCVIFTQSSVCHYLCSVAAPSDGKMLC